MLRAKEDMEERYAKQHHNTRERHADEMRRQAAIHSVKMERLRTDHAAEMAKVLEEFNASKEFKAYSEDPPSWFTELFSAQLLRPSRRRLPGVRAWRHVREPRGPTGAPQWHPVPVRAREELRAGPRARVGVPERLPGEGGVETRARGRGRGRSPRRSEVPTMRPPSNNAMAFASESDDRMRSAPSPSSSL